MARKTTTRRAKRRTYRRNRRALRGGDKAVQAMIAKYPLGKPVIVNPKSKFVVCTYWWGRGNLNKNFWRFGDAKTEAEIKEGKVRVNYACPSEISEDMKWDYLDELREEAQEQIEEAIEVEVEKALAKLPATATPDERALLRKKTVNGYIRNWDNVTLGSPKFKDALTAKVNKHLDDLVAKGEEKEKRITMEDMIDNWKKMCVKANCNYLVQEYPFERKDYQTAINMKPLFIAEVLKVVGKEGRAALYIDGDMVIDRYPDIFDMPSVDFMARGWNCDPRSSSKYLEKLCFDPYIFETSGGIMYYAPTEPARNLLATWNHLSSLPSMKGKADDRILSIVLTMEREKDAISTIQLPIEYLWLTDAYLYQPPGDIDKSRIYVSHPACLTSEEAAREQGAADSREPPGYERDIIDPTNCETNGGYFYEYVYFTERRFVETFAPYLKYLRRALNKDKQPLFKVIDFEDKYGPYNTVSLRNIDAMNSVAVPTTKQKMVTLPQGATVPQILAHLKAGMDVVVGRYVGKFPADLDLLATNNGVNKISEYQTEVIIDTTRPMFFSARNPVLYHLLMMCKTLDDINMHYRQSYLFSSRIRGYWLKTDRPVPTTEELAELEKIELEQKYATVP